MLLYQATDSLADTLLYQKFSVSTDESTDISSVKTSCIVVRFFDESTMKMCSKFWELHQIFSKDDVNRANEGANGKSIFEGVMESFCEEMPGIIIIRCICHSAHLCASEACKTLQGDARI